MKQGAKSNMYKTAWHTLKSGTVLTRFSTVQCGAEKEKYIQYCTVPC